MTAQLTASMHRLASAAVVSAATLAPSAGSMLDATCNSTVAALSMSTVDEVLKSGSEGGASAAAAAHVDTARAKLCSASRASREERAEEGMVMATVA